MNREPIGDDCPTCGEEFRQMEQGENTQHETDGFIVTCPSGHRYAWDSKRLADADSRDR